jgi:hypothetical protein
MVFGSKKRKETESEHEAQAHSGSGEADDIDLVDADSGEDEVTEEQSGKKVNLLFEEVTILSGGHGKNPGGTKKWQCKHCKKTFSSTVTRIKHHFFGAPPGKKAQITRCSALQSDRAKYRELYDKVGYDFCTISIHY